jgi:hypothetical protein
MQGLPSLARVFVCAWPLTFALLSGCSSGGSDTADAGDGMPSCTLGSTMPEIEDKLLRGDKCKTCHTLTSMGLHPLYPTNLEFTTPDIAARMVDKPSESDPFKGKCSGRILIPKDDPLNGLFVQKILTPPPCGDRMPQALPPLTANEASCLQRWAILAAKSVQ